MQWYGAGSNCPLEKPEYRPKTWFQEREKKKQHRRVTVLPFPGFNSGIWGQCACNSTLRCGRSGVVERFCVQEIAMQAASSGIGYGLKYQVQPAKPSQVILIDLILPFLILCFWWQARCISDVKADTDHTSFLAGTLSLKEENEVHLHIFSFLALQFPRLIRVDSNRMVPS